MMSSEEKKIAVFEAEALFIPFVRPAVVRRRFIIFRQVQQYFAISTS
jgi:hypothetical protein